MKKLAVIKSPYSPESPLVFNRAVKKPIEVEFCRIDEDFVVEQGQEGEGNRPSVTFGKAGDYLMKGIAGELYVCPKEIFEATYDLLSE
jgi:hypothetical protein